jgi:hypothetical protein
MQMLRRTLLIDALHAALEKKPSTVLVWISGLLMST